MLTWATEFPLAGGSAGDVLGIAAHTLETSPYTPWEVGDVPTPPEGDLLTASRDGHTVTAGKATTNDGNVIAGSRYHWIEDGERDWTTEVVAFESGGKVLASDRVECNLLAPGPQVPLTRKPYVVKRLLQRLGGGDDAGFKVSDHPHLLRESDVARAAAVVHGNSGVRLPVVYVSVGRQRRPYIDTDELAHWLSGMAHVVVEPSRYFSFALARNSGRMNAYGGAASIYWPQGASSQVRFVPASYADPDSMQREIASRVRTALTQIRPTSNCTFDYLQETIASHRVTVLKSQGTAGIELYVAAFDADIRAKDERIASLDRETQRLRAELKRRDYSDADSAGLLAPGKEKEFYSGEVRDAVLHVLRNGRNSLLEDGRRSHIISDLLEHNKPTGTEDDYDEEIKNAFSESGDLAGDSRRILEDLGFTIENGGKHWKVLYQGDDRYTFTISKTSSDHRAGKNLASTILKKLFK